MEHHSIKIIIGLGIFLVLFMGIAGINIQTEKVAANNIIKQKSIISLQDWNIDEIVYAMSYYNPIIKPASYYTFKYNDDCTYTDSNYIKHDDKFCSIRFAPSGREWPPYNLRVYQLINKQDYADYIDSITRQISINPGLICYQQTECNNIRVFICLKEKQSLYIWEKDNFLFTSSKRDPLSAFTEFYCTKNSQLLTSAAVYNDNTLNKLGKFIQERLSNINS